VKPSAVTLAPAPLSLLLNPYVWLAFNAVATTASELFMKVGAVHQPMTLLGFGIGALASVFTWLGIICYLISFASWIYVLRQLPLAGAYAISCIVHALIPVGCWLFLHEAISLQRWVGISLVAVGLALVIQPIARIEEKVEQALANAPSRAGSRNDESNAESATKVTEGAAA